MFKQTMTLAFVLLAFQVFAQKQMVWDKHGVGFTVPDNFKIEKNDATEYTASNDVMALTIMPHQDETISKEHLADALLTMAHSLEYETLEGVSQVELHDFVGYLVEGKKEGVNVVLMALLDTESSTNLFVSIVYAEGQLDAAVSLAKSFYAYD